MATKTFYTLNTANANWGQLQEGGSAPAAAASAYGWANAKVAAGYWRARVGAAATAATTQASTYLGAASLLQGTGTTNTTASNAFRSPTTYNGTFANTTWPFSFGVRTGAASHAGAMRVQIWRSVNADGTSATKIGGVGVGGTVTLAATATTYTSSGSVAAPGAITLTNEYLFFEVEWQGTVAGTSNSCTTLFYQGVCTFTTPDFTPAAQTLTQSATFIDPADVFYAPTVFFPPQSLTQTTRHDDADSFPQATAVSLYALTAGLTSNDQTFNDPTVVGGAAPGQDLAPILHSNAQTFQTPSLAASNPLTQSARYNNPAATFPSAAISLVIAPALYSDPDSFKSAAITPTYGLAPPRHPNTQTFPTPVMGAGLTPALHSNVQGFSTPSLLSSTTLTPPFFVNVQNFLLGDPYFFLPIVVEAKQPINPALYSNTQTFFAPTVALGLAWQTLTPALYPDPDSFPTPIIVRDLAPSLYSDPDGLAFTHSIAVGGVTLFPGMYNDPDTFFGAAMTGGIPAGAGLARTHPFLENVGQIWERT